jgi:hypothetical protein
MLPPPPLPPSLPSVLPYITNDLRPSDPRRNNNPLPPLRGPPRPAHHAPPPRAPPRPRHPEIRRRHCSRRLPVRADPVLQFLFSQCSRGSGWRSRGWRRGWSGRYGWGSGRQGEGGGCASGDSAAGVWRGGSGGRGGRAWCAWREDGAYDGGFGDGGGGVWG